MSDVALVALIICGAVALALLVTCYVHRSRHPLREARRVASEQRHFRAWDREYKSWAKEFARDCPRF